MSLRTRALLGGIARGFLKSNNDRHDRMEQRAAQLAEKQGIMERERAKSRYASAIQAAEQEEKTWDEYKSKDWIDAEGNFTSAYYRDQTYDKWKESEYKDQEEFIEIWKKDRAPKLTRSYKSPQVLQKEMASIYNSIDNREREALARPVLTGFEKMMGFGLVKGVQAGASAFNSGAEALGVDARAKAIPMPEVLQGGSQATSAQTSTIAPPSAPKAVQAVSGDSEGEPVIDTTDAPDFFSVPDEEPEPQRLSQFTEDSEGNMVAVFVDKEEGAKVVPVGVKTAAPTPEAPLRLVRLFDKKGKQYNSAPVEYNPNTNSVLVGGQWTKLGADFDIMPAERKMITHKYPDPETGVLKEWKGYETSGFAEGANTIVLDDGTKFAVIGEGTEVRDNAGNPIVAKKPKLPKEIEDSMSKNIEIERTLRLAQEITSDDFITSPTSWAKANLSVMTDVLGASIGLEGEDRPKDLEAMVDFANDEIKDVDGLEDQVGTLDAAAIRRGNRTAIENFLIFSLARSQFGQGRLNVKSIEMAEEVVSPLFKGTDADRAAMASVITLSQKDLIESTTRAVSYAQGQGSDSPIWDRYYNTKLKIKQGLKPLTSSSGDILIRKINKMSPEVKEATIRDLERNFPNGWEDALSNPIRYNRNKRRLNMIMYSEREDGSLRFGTFDMK